MAVAPTGAIYKSLIFDGEDSRDYGVYITGEAVYNAPERDVEMIAIPGRNGAFALDKGRFENIEVSYPAGIFADNETDFAEAISDFRNFLCSRKGYCRLEDEYNPNEYRMAVYKSGLEVSPTQLITGEFEIIFECKPQRWLTSGETAVSVTSGDTITNPTLFEASPLLEVEGYGEIDINRNVITLNNIEIGNISLLSSIEDSGSGGSAFTTYQITRTFDATFLNNGDALQLGDISGITQHIMMPTIKSLSGSITSISGAAVSCSSDTLSKRITIPSSDLSFVYGTPKTITGTATISVTITYTNNTTATSTITLTLTVAYDGSEEITVLINHPAFGPYQSNHNMGIKFSELTGYSTKSALSDAVYIDLDIGEAWTENSGVVVPLNDAVIMPANLPTLLPGSNTITFDNTITDLKITPRWWKV